ncbi:MAG: hypothetical protein R3B09_04605 [Nannocystaceae bacterium]
MELARAFQEGGVLMFPIAFAGATAWATGVLAVILRSRPLGLVALVAALLTLGVGVFAWQIGLEEVRAALETVSGEYREEARALGTRISEIPLKFAALGAVPGVIGGLVGVLLGRSR